MIQNIIFDFDGVLVDSEIIAAKAFSRYLGKRNIIFSEEQFCIEYSGNKTVNVISDLSTKFDIKEKELFFKEVMSIANNIYSSELTSIEGIKVLLSILDQKKFIGSNSPKKRIIDGLKIVKLEEYFDQDNIFSFDMVEKPKPYPDVYLKTLASSGIKSDDTIIIEDSIVGVRAGIAANIKVIGFTSGGHWKGRSPQILLDNGATAVAKNYKELLNMIKKL